MDGNGCEGATKSEALAGSPRARRGHDSRTMLTSTHLHLRALLETLFENSTRSLIQVLVQSLLPILFSIRRPTLAIKCDQGSLGLSSPCIHHAAPTPPRRRPVVLNLS